MGECFNISVAQSSLQPFFSNRGTGQCGKSGHWASGRSHSLIVRMFFLVWPTTFIICFVYTACPTHNQKDSLKRSKTVPKSRGTASTAGVECVKCGEEGHYGEGEW